MLFFNDRILSFLCRIYSEGKLTSLSRPLYCQQAIFLSPNLPNLQICSYNRYCLHNQLSHWVAIGLLFCWKQTHDKLRQKSKRVLCCNFVSRFNTNSGQNHQRNKRQMWRKVGTVWPTWLWRAHPSHIEGVKLCTLQTSWCVWQNPLLFTFYSVCHSASHTVGKSSVLYGNFLFELVNLLATCECY